MAAALRWFKRLIGHQDDLPPTASLADLAPPSSTFKPRTIGSGVKTYVLSLFPVLQWAGRYNVHWLSGDVIAGLTVGMVLVPQGMSYAKLAGLDPQYGLYSSFVGVFIYCFFSTSKDVSIGPVAVMSLEVGKIVAHVQHTHPGRWDAPTIATAIAFVCGFIVLGIGLLRIGRIVEWIPAPAVSGFMTGSAITIASGQVPGLLGTARLFNTREETYKVIINTLKHLPDATKDAAFGVMGLFALYAIRWTFSYLSKRYPRRARTFFFISITRNAFVMVVLTLSSWLYCRRRADSKGNYPIQILKKVPRGFQHVRPPIIESALVSAIGPDLFVATIILLLEHIAISKSFGRINGYKIDPNQELIAIGVTNTVGTVFGAYPATGSFSRSALKAKSGVRTPAAGWLTGLVVIVALYGLTDAFFWIPNAGLSAIIIHAVADLVATPSQVYTFWRVSPVESVIWWAAVLVTIFTSIEIGIYTSIISSLVVLVFRIMVPRGAFLGRVTVQSGDAEFREVFVPLQKKGAINSQIQVSAPYPGVVIYRHEEGLLYPNSSAFNHILVDYIKLHTRQGKDMRTVPLRDRLWNEPGPKPGAHLNDDSLNLHLPILKAVVLDFSTVTHVDTTAIQSLVDTRLEVEKWADAPVEFHFANILSPWIRRALVAGGFGLASGHRDIAIEVAPVVSQHDSYEKGGDTSPSALKKEGYDLESPDADRTNSDRVEPIVSPDTPYFHFDLTTAVKSAEDVARGGETKGLAG